MHEVIEKDYVIVDVHSFFYKIPYFVLMDEPMLRRMYGPNIDVLRYEHDFCENRSEALEPIKALIALKPKEYYSFRYSKLLEIDEDREAMKSYVDQFEGEDTLSQLKRELAFFAGMQYRDLKKPKAYAQFTIAVKELFGGTPSEINVLLPKGKYWPCFSHMSELMQKEFDMKNQTQAEMDATVKAVDRLPESRLSFNGISLSIKEEKV